MPNIRIKKRMFAKKTKKMKDGDYKKLAQDYQTLEKYFISYYKHVTHAKRLGKKPGIYKLTDKQYNKLIDERKKAQALIDPENFKTNNCGWHKNSALTNLLKLTSDTANSYDEANPIVGSPTEIEEN